MTMSEIRGSWVPETKAEDDLLMDLHEATRQAHEKGVDTRDIAACMQYLSAAIVLYGDEATPGDVDARETEEVAQKASDCPVCDQEIDTVLGSMGGEAIVKPCGCVSRVDELSGWFDD